VAKDEKVRDMRLPGGKGLLITLYGKGDHHEIDLRAHTGPDEVTHVQGSVSWDIQPHSPEPGKPMPDWMQPLMQVAMAMVQTMAQQPFGAPGEQPKPEREQSEGDAECQPSGT